MPGPASTVSEWCTSLKEHDEEMRWLAELFPLEELVDGSIPDELAGSVLWRVACGTSRRRTSADTPCSFPRRRIVDGKSGCDGRRLDDGQSFFFHATHSDERKCSVGARLPKRGMRIGLLSHAMLSRGNWL